MNLTRRMATALVLTPFVLAAARAADAPPSSAPDPFAPLARFIGNWAGQASGQPGEGDVTRSYSFVMNKRFMQETNISRYPPQEKNKRGEVHEHLGMFSFDKARKTIVLRQFHIESFVNTYRMLPTEGGTTLVFESEAFENLRPGWRARETYKFVSDDEFTETFELAAPDKPFEVYSQTKFKRVKATEQGGAR